MNSEIHSGNVNTDINADSNPNGITWDTLRQDASEMRAEVEANNKAVNSAIDATKEYLGPYFENTCKHFTLRFIKYYETTRQKGKSRQYLAGLCFHLLSFFFCLVLHCPYSASASLAAWAAAVVTTLQ